jgi:hypothetical protein
VESGVMIDGVSNWVDGVGGEVESGGSVARKA